MFIQSGVLGWAEAQPPGWLGPGSKAPGLPSGPFSTYPGPELALHNFLAHLHFFFLPPSSHLNLFTFRPQHLGSRHVHSGTSQAVRRELCDRALPETWEGEEKMEPQFLIKTLPSAFNSAPTYQVPPHARHNLQTWTSTELAVEGLEAPSLIPAKT